MLKLLKPILVHLSEGGGGRLPLWQRRAGAASKSQLEPALLAKWSGDSGFHGETCQIKGCGTVVVVVVVGPRRGKQNWYSLVFAGGAGMFSQRVRVI